MRFWSVFSETKHSFLFFHLHCYHCRQQGKQAFPVKQRYCRISQSCYSATENVNNWPHSAVLSWRKINVTPSEEIPFCVEIHKQKGNEWPMALTTKSFNTSDGQVGKTYVNVMKGLCNSYTRWRRNSSSPVWKRLGIKLRPDTWLLEKKSHSPYIKVPADPEN